MHNDDRFVHPHRERVGERTISEKKFGNRVDPDGVARIAVESPQVRKLAGPQANTCCEVLIPNPFEETEIREPPRECLEVRDSGQRRRGVEVHGMPILRGRRETSRRDRVRQGVAPSVDMAACGRPKQETRGSKCMRKDLDLD